MQFLNLTDGDWQLYLQWAKREGWQVSFHEQRLFQNLWRPYFFALHVGGELRGFVSAVAYRESGWIGNLLVPEQQRGQGFGSALFDFALEFLRQSKPRRIWLTASETGQPIYERRGFRVIDSIERWSILGRKTEESHPGTTVAELVDTDTQCWGESRSPLINALADDGVVLKVGQTIGLLQSGPGTFQLGPWLSFDKSAQDNRLLLQQAIGRTAHGKELLVDVLASAEMGLVLHSSGFKCKGTNQLMLFSEEAVPLDGVMALASLGSIG